MVLLPMAVEANGLIAGAQLGVSRGAQYNPFDATYEPWTVWGASTWGNLVSLREPLAGPSPLWEDRLNPLGGSPPAEGVTAVGWSSGGAFYERAYFVDKPNNRIIEYGLVSGAPGAMAPIPAPTCPTGACIFTGTLAAAVRRNGLGYTVILFATTKDAAQSTAARLWVAEISTVNGAATWISRFPSQPANIAITSPLATTRTWDDLWPRVFARTTTATDRVVTSRYNQNNSQWEDADLGQPAGNVKVCGTMAAAEASLGSPAGYKTYLFCTRRDAANNVVYLASADGVGTLVLTWQPSLTLPAGENARNSGYSLAATTRTGSSGPTIDAFVLTSLDKVRHSMQTLNGAALTSFADLGADGETVSRSGPLAATPVLPKSGASSGYSHVYFLGPIGGATRLYRRVGDEGQSASTTWNWTNHQDGSARTFIASSGLATESSTAVVRAS